MCKLKKVSNVKREGGQGEEENADEEEVSPAEGGDEEGAAPRGAPSAGGKGAASTAPLQSRRRKRPFNLEQPGGPTLPVNKPAYLASTALRMGRWCN